MNEFLEFTVGKKRSRRYVRVDTILRLIEYTDGEFGERTGIVIEGEPEPIWVELSYDECVKLIKRASKPSRPKLLKEPSDA